MTSRLLIGLEINEEIAEANRDAMQKISICVETMKDKKLISSGMELQIRVYRVNVTEHCH